MVGSISWPSIQEQIDALPRDRLFEIVDDQVLEIPSMGMLATTFASVLVSFINAYAMPKRLGLAIGEGLYRFSPERPQRRPDVSFIASNAWPANLTALSDPPSLTAVPALAVEVVSPTNTSSEIEEKRQEYFDAGVKVVWIVHPIPRTIHVYRSARDCHVIDASGSLDGGEAIPGFQVKVSELFDCIFPPDVGLK